MTIFVVHRTKKYMQTDMDV